MSGIQKNARWPWLIGLSLTVAGCQPSVRMLDGPAIVGNPAQSTEAKGLASAPVILASAKSAPYVRTLNMRAAMRRSVRHSPVLRAVSEEINARQGEAFQAGRRPNPELETEVENFGGSGGFSGFGAAETTIGLAQSIELGGKRLKRLRVAELDVSLANWDYEAARLTIASQTLQAFVDVLAAQERLAIRREFETITSRLTDTVSERVKAGKVSAVELNRAEVEQARATVAVREVQANLDVARRQLALFWGARAPDFGKAVGRLAATNHLPSPERFNTYLERNPNVARWADEIAQRQASFELERARRIPNLTVGAGVRRFEETGDSAVVAGFSIALPFFDRNRGNIDAASARIAKSLYEHSAAKIDLRSRFVEAYGLLRASEAKLRALESKVLPKAKEAFDAIERGYREGKFDLLNVLDAQRSLIEVRLDVVNTQAEFHKAKAVIEGLIGRDLYKL